MGGGKRRGSEITSPEGITSNELPERLVRLKVQCSCSSVTEQPKVFTLSGHTTGVSHSNTKLQSSFLIIFGLPCYQRTQQDILGLNFGEFVVLSASPCPATVSLSYYQGQTLLTVGQTSYLCITTCNKKATNEVHSTQLQKTIKAVTEVHKVVY